MINILWVIVVISAAVSQWYIIEVQRKYPNKPFWFIIRILVGLFFLGLYLHNGYVYYWAILYMVGVFWFPFNTILNALRKKRFGYLSPKNSPVDDVLMRVFKYESIITFLSFFLFILSVLMMIFYGFSTLEELNRF